jgi:hypothetical protein
VIAVGEYQAAVNRRKSPKTERVPLDLFSRVVPDDDVLAVPSSGAQEQRSGSSANGGGAAQILSHRGLGLSPGCFGSGVGF